MKKTAKTLIIVVLILSLTLALIVRSASAAGPGSITVVNAKAQETYSLYRLFALQSYDMNTGSFLYTVTSDWASFITDESIEDIYIEQDHYGYVSWVDGADPAIFAQLALTYAEANSITPVASAVISADENGVPSVSPDTDLSVAVEPSGTYSLSFSALPLGYYLLDSTAGVLCSLDTTTPSVTIYEKNTGLPLIEKTVKEDSTDTFEIYNTADIGQLIEFQTTVIANNTAQNYVLHDTMSSGLDFSGTDSLQVQWTDPAGTEYTYQPVPGTDYTVTTDCPDGCTFELTFAQSFCDQLKNYDRLIVSYTGHLNANAVIGGSGNENTATLTYGDSTETKTDSTYTYTGEVYIYKYTRGDAGTFPLANAQFQLSNQEGNWYRRDETTGLISWVANQSQGTLLSSGSDGMLVFPGLDADPKYKLFEVVAPAGYTLCTPIVFAHTIDVDAAGTALMSQTEDYPLWILNTTSAMLPQTGGIGTTALYCTGSLLIFIGLLLLRKETRLGKRCCFAQTRNNKSKR